MSSGVEGKHLSSKVFIKNGKCGRKQIWRAVAQFEVAVLFDTSRGPDENLI